jgi:basic amino acid/polyamine antiporter, APA family
MQVRPKLKLISAISIVIGCTIGSGVFVKPGRVLVAASDSNLALLAWLLGGLISLTAGLTVAEIGSRIPKTGGVYSFMEELFGKEVGFITGWVQTLIYGPGLLAALAAFFASLFCQFFNLDTSVQIPVALLTLFSLSSISILGTKYSAWIQNTTTFIKLLPIFAIGIFGLFYGIEPVFGVTVPSTLPAAGMSAAVLSTLWAYDGWMQVSNIAGEIENPSKNLPRAIIIGLLVVISVYLLVNMALFHTLPIADIATLNEKAAAVASTKLFGTIGGTLLGLGVLVSIFGCLNGNILTMTRVPYAIALNGVFPFRKQFATLHPKFQTPVYSVLLKVFCATVMIILMNPDRITDLAIFSMYIIYAVCFIGVFKLRKKYGVPVAGNYKIPFYPVVPLIAVGGCGFICYGMVVQNPLDACISVGITLSGYPIFKWLQKRP